MLLISRNVDKTSVGDGEGVKYAAPDGAFLLARANLQICRAYGSWPEVMVRAIRPGQKVGGAIFAAL